MILVICGRFGGCSSLDGSGAACRCTSSDDLSTVSDADHVVSPLSDEAAQVYNPLSAYCKSANYFKIIIGNNNRNLLNWKFFKLIKEQQIVRQVSYIITVTGLTHTI